MFASDVMPVLRRECGGAADLPGVHGAAGAGAGNRGQRWRLLDRRWCFPKTRPSSCLRSS